MKITAEDIQIAVFSQYKSSIWGPKASVGVFNSYSLNSWESDILIIQPSGRVYEVEVKISVSDFRNERKAETKVEKHRSISAGCHNGSRPPVKLARFYYAMPRDVFEKVRDEIPEGYGVIVVEPRPSSYSSDYYWDARIEIEAKNLPTAKNLATDADRVELLRGVYWRWIRKQTRRKFTMDS